MTTHKPKRLCIDIETSLFEVYTFDLWRTTIGIEKIIKPSRPLCFAAKWYGEPAKTMQFHSVQGHDKDAQEDVAALAWNLLDEADDVIHYNGVSFDTRRLNAEFARYHWSPPSPYKQIDLYLGVRKQFDFASNKLAYIVEELELSHKIKNSGLDLWIKVMQDDPVAWKEMERYNRRDVVLVEELYNDIKAWLPSHPSYAAFTGERVCPTCGGTSLQSRGYTYTKVSKYRRLWCTICGTWSRETKRESGATLTSVPL